MAEVDVRGVLQYVPLFRGRTFVVLFGEGLPEPAVAEALLDLKALQEVKVQLVIGVLGEDVEEFADRATELEIKFARVAAPPGERQECLKETGTVLERGQAALLDCRGFEALDRRVVDLASGLGAAKLITLLNGAGVTLDGEPLHAVPASQVPGVAAAVESSDLLRIAAESCEAGIPRVHLLDGRLQGVLTAELFSNEGVGTMVHADAYREVRALREEDIPELLAMIGRSVRRAYLVSRDYDEIVSKREDFVVLCLDDNVVGCVALHRYGPVGEVACLYVKQSHESRGYGRTLVEAAEEQARKVGLTGVFALTNRAAKFFRSLGYEGGSLDAVPGERRAKLEASCRDSVVLEKRF